MNVPLTKDDIENVNYLSTLSKSELLKLCESNKYILQLCNTYTILFNKIFLEN